MTYIENIDTSRLDAGIAGLINKCRIDSKVVVEKETGEMIKTLVRISPPRDPRRTRTAIQAKIDARFTALSESYSLESTATTQSKKYADTEWYASTSSYLFGIAKSKDLRKADVSTLRQVFLRTRMMGRKGSEKKARQIFPFLKRNTRQKVAILQNVITEQRKIEKLKRNLVKNVGRLKAGWLVAPTAGAIRMSASNAIPQWVSRHAKGARGRFEPGLDTPGNPSFAIANFAQGITGKAAFGLAQRAINIRADAILANTRMFLSGKKFIGDYARFATS